MATVRSAITKGRNFQRRVAIAFKEAFRFNDDDIRTAIGAENGEDIKLSTGARKKIQLSIECKDVKSLNIFKAIEQAKKNCPDGCYEAVVFKRGTPGPNTTYICVPLKHYLAERTARMS